MVEYRALKPFRYGGRYWQVGETVPLEQRHSMIYKRAKAVEEVDAGAEKVRAKSAENDAVSTQVTADTKADNTPKAEPTAKTTTKAKEGTAPKKRGRPKKADSKAAD